MVLTLCWQDNCIHVYAYIIPLQCDFNVKHILHEINKLYKPTDTNLSTYKLKGKGNAMPVSFMQAYKQGTYTDNCIHVWQLEIGMSKDYEWAYWYKNLLSCKYCIYTCTRCAQALYKLLCDSITTYYIYVFIHCTLYKVNLSLKFFNKGGVIDQAQWNKCTCQSEIAHT